TSSVIKPNGGKLSAIDTPAITALNARVAPSNRYVLRRTLFVVSAEGRAPVTTELGYRSIQLTYGEYRSANLDSNGNREFPPRPGVWILATLFGTTSR